MGKWIDAGEIKMIHDFEDERYRELDREMRKKPNFDHYENKNYERNKKRSRKCNSKE